MTLVTETDLVVIPTTTPSKEIPLLLDHLLPSTPRDTRNSRSQSQSNKRNKVNRIQPVISNDTIILQYTCIAQLKRKTLRHQPYGFTQYTPQQNTKHDYPSRLEKSFILVYGASSSALNYPTNITSVKPLTTPCKKSLLSSKTITFLTVPILHYVTITLSTIVKDN